MKMREKERKKERKEGRKKGRKKGRKEDEKYCTVQDENDGKRKKERRKILHCTR